MSADFCFTPLKKKNKEGSISSGPFNALNDDHKFSGNLNPSFSYINNPNNFNNNYNNTNINFLPYKPTSINNNQLQNKNFTLNSPFFQEKQNNMNNNINNSSFDNQLYNNQRNNNTIKTQFSSINEYQFNLNKNNSNPVYLCISGYDEFMKKTLLNFLERQNISNSDIRIIGGDKILITFHYEEKKFQFMRDYQEIREQFIGVDVREIDRNEYNNSINNIVTRGSANMGYDDNDEINEVLSLPPRRSTWEKFLDVFFNF